MFYTATLIADKSLKLIARGNGKRQLLLVYLYPLFCGNRERTRLLKIGKLRCLGCAINLVYLILQVCCSRGIHSICGSTVIAKLHNAILVRRSLDVDKEEAHTIVKHLLSHTATFAANKRSHHIAVGGKGFEYWR